MRTCPVAHIKRPPLFTIAKEIIGKRVPPLTITFFRLPNYVLSESDADAVCRRFR